MSSAGAKNLIVHTSPPLWVLNHKSYRRSYADRKAGHSCASWGADLVTLYLGSWPPSGSICSTGSFSLLCINHHASAERHVRSYRQVWDTVKPFSGACREECRFRSGLFWLIFGENPSWLSLSVVEGWSALRWRLSRDADVLFATY